MVPGGNAICAQARLTYEALRVSTDRLITVSLWSHSYVCVFHRTFRIPCGIYLMLFLLAFAVVVRVRVTNTTR